eukprot:TRINITY_DN9640_c0_g2_i1.p1 TRINITY_DN9640_c0_g2~~TRINITY_DN9640_c0_g2_i1.p1  ORF type:complete len:213 (-),score=24.36 TRINITY_DN9640_c0_g2_i1:26-571(-)
MDPKVHIDSHNWYFPPDNYDQAFINACERGYFAIVKRMLKDERVNPSAKHNLAITLACRNGHLEVVNHLLENERVDPSFGPIHKACRMGHLAIVQRLLEDPRVDPFISNKALSKAIKHGHLSVVKRLLEDDRINVSEDINKAIQEACLQGNVDTVEITKEDKCTQYNVVFSTGKRLSLIHI